jgi:hypothetical protein
MFELDGQMWEKQVFLEQEDSDAIGLAMAHVVDILIRHYVKLKRK